MTPHDPVDLDYAMWAYGREDSATRAVIARYQPYTRWSFTVDDLGTVGVQCRDDVHQWPITERIDKWLLDALEDQGGSDRRKLYELAADLLKNGAFERPPIIRTSDLNSGRKVPTS
jgi:hypothetical protein